MSPPSIGTSESCACRERAQNDASGFFRGIACRRDDQVWRRSCSVEGGDQSRIVGSSCGSSRPRPVGERRRFPAAVRLSGSSRWATWIPPLSGTALILLFVWSLESGWLWFGSCSLSDSVTDSVFFGRPRLPISRLIPRWDAFLISSSALRVNQSLLGFGQEHRRIKRRSRRVRVSRLRAAGGAVPCRWKRLLGGVVVLEHQQEGTVLGRDRVAGVALVIADVA